MSLQGLAPEFERNLVKGELFLIKLLVILEVCVHVAKIRCAVVVFRICSLFLASLHFHSSCKTIGTMNSSVLPLNSILRFTVIKMGCRLTLKAEKEAYSIYITERPD